MHKIVAYDSILAHDFMTKTTSSMRNMRATRGVVIAKNARWEALRQFLRREARDVRFLPEHFVVPFQIEKSERSKWGKLLHFSTFISRKYSEFLQQTIRFSLRRL